MSSSDSAPPNLGYVDLPPVGIPSEWALANETMGEKFWRKFKQNPLIPVGKDGVTS